MISSMKKKTPGRPRKISRSAAAIISRALSSNIPVTEVAKIAHVSRSTLYAHLNRAGGKSKVSAP